MIWTTLIVLFGYEALMWGWTMNRHASWLCKHPEEEDRIPLVGYQRLRFISATSGIASGVATLGWVTVVAEHSFDVTRHGYMFGFVVLLIQLSHINLFTVIARYTCLPRSMWPLISTGISRVIVRYLGVEPPPLSSADVHHCKYKRLRKGDKSYGNC